MVDIGPVDLFVIDEFYKLNPTGAQDDRAYLLNHAFYRLNKLAPQFYMLGPSVIGLSSTTRERIKCTFIAENYHTVVSELHRVDSVPDEMSALVELCRTLDDPTIIYCRSPRRASEVARALINSDVGNPMATMDEAAEWIAEQYHPAWHFGLGLAQGIGVHHGRIPRALGQFVIKQFNDEHLRFLVCTSTLIEGINTKARNIVILDDRINRTEIDRFTFNNIRGRAGRMGQHFIGHVYIFHDPPPEGLPLIDVPAISQADGTPPSLLIQLDEEDLEDNSRANLEQYLSQDTLSIETLKKNVGVDLESQLKLARKLQSEATRLNDLLAWEQFPTWRQLQAACELIWDNFGGLRLGSGSVRSARQLAFLVWRLSERPRVTDMIASQIDFADDPDDAVEQVLDFLRLWASFHFPRLLRTLDNIQSEVFSRLGLPVGHYAQYATVVENLFMDPALVALDEYGLPLEIARKLEAHINPDGDLDAVLDRLRRLDAQSLGLSPFEQAILVDTISAL